MEYRKNKKEVNVQILSRRSMLKPEDFIARLRHHCEALPKLLPERWGFWEPLKNIFDFAQLDKMIPNDRGGAADNWIWKRNKVPKASGSLDVAWISGVEGVLNTHASEHIEYDLGTVDTKEVVAYVQDSCLKFDGDLAIIDSCTLEYYERYMVVHDRYEGAYIGNSFSVVTHTLRHWLPDVYWGTVFGSAYVKMFGLEVLLSAPAFLVKKLSNEAVYIQLSPNLQDLYDDFDAVQKVREAVKDYLGRDAFFSVDKAYPLRGPMGNPPDYEVTAEQMRTFEPPAPIGTVFRVPDFKLIIDEYL
jgi:hypothetical protein